jgi:hypothetical protein
MFIKLIGEKELIARSTSLLLAGDCIPGRKGTHDYGYGGSLSSGPRRGTKRGKRDRKSVIAG